MTKLHDDNARRDMLSRYQEKDFLYNNIPIREMTIKRITVKEARPYIATFHYSKTMPDSSRYVYAGYLGERLCGIVVYGMGTGKSQYTSIIKDIQKGEYLELTRLWCPHNMPKNTESKLISLSLKMLPSEIKFILSFSDLEKNHVGTIYQATNWHYLGLSKTHGRTIITSDGVKKHARLLSVYKEKNPHLRELSNNEIMERYGWTFESRTTKCRYVFLRGTKAEKRRFYNQIKDSIGTYPKLERASFSQLTESEIVARERAALRDNGESFQMSFLD